MSHVGSKFDPVVVEALVKILGAGRQEEILTDARLRALLAGAVSPPLDPLLVFANALRGA